MAFSHAVVMVLRSWSSSSNIFSKKIIALKEDISFHIKGLHRIFPCEEHTESATLECGATKRAQKIIQ